MTVQQWLNSSEESKKNPFEPFWPEGDIRIGTVVFDAKENMFRIYEGKESDDTYDMAADRILSGKGLLDFVFQVHTKEWVSGQHLKDLLDCITCWTYREHGKFPQEFFDVAGGMNSNLDDPGKL